MIPKEPGTTPTTKFGSKAGSLQGEATTKTPHKDVEEYHTNSDVDFSSKSQHHTLGDGPTQAAVGSDVAKLKEGQRIGDFKWSLDNRESREWKLCNGQLLLLQDFQELFNLTADVYGDGYFFGTGGGGTQFGVPNIQDRSFVAEGSLVGTVGIFGGAAFYELDHTHAVPNHVHSAGGYATDTFTHNTAANTTFTSTGNRLTSPAGHSHAVTGNSGNPTAAITTTPGPTWLDNSPFSPSPDANDFISMYHPYFVCPLLIKVK